MHHDAASSLQGTVEKIIIKPMILGEAEKVQISIQSGDDPNQKIRIKEGRSCADRRQTEAETPN